MTVANFKFDLKRWVIFPSLISCASAYISKGVINVFSAAGNIKAIALIGVFAIFYIGLLIITKTFKKEDIAWVVSFFKRENDN